MSYVLILGVVASRNVDKCHYPKLKKPSTGCSASTKAFSVSLHLQPGLFFFEFSEIS
jgi:hypothetical protein